jgi:class 3 adenylate cyclase
LNSRATNFSPRSTVRRDPYIAQSVSATRCELGIEICAGVHTGEIERRPHEIGGVAVNLASRVLALARPGEILVSGTVTDLVIGAGIRFEERGIQALKGIPDTWRLFAVTDAE